MQRNTHARISVLARLAIVAAMVVTMLFGMARLASPVLAYTMLCSGSSYSTCTNAGYTDHGYAANSSTSYWGAYPGHNCTNYVAYVETQNGVHPNYTLGNAADWWSQASGHVTESTTTPVVGSAAWWGANQGGMGSDGHVAYVEAVSGSPGNYTITISEDAYPSGPFDWMKITQGDSRWPGGFIYFANLSVSRANWIPITGDWDGNGTTTIGTYDPNTATFYLRNSNTSGVSDIAFRYGNPGWIPITGDWTGSGKTSIGVYDPSTATFYLRTDTSSVENTIAFQYGNPGWIPITGDWDGNGTTTIGVYVPSSATYYLRNSNTAGVSDIGFTYGGANWKPITGDWDGNGTTTIGVYDPSTVGYYLRNSNTGGYSDIAVPYGNGGTWVPITGDWTGSGKTSIGVYDPSTATFYLRTDTSSVENTIAFQYGNPN